MIKNNFFKEDEILIISLTNETVNQLKDKIKYEIDIKTFHKLGLDILKQTRTNVTLARDGELKYIINEYLLSYANEDKKTFKMHKRINIISTDKSLIVLICTFINIYKSNYDDIHHLYQLYKKSFFIKKDYYKIILDIYLIYLRELESVGKYDFHDLLTEATKDVKSKKYISKYKYIIIDEFQDASAVRFNLINALLKQNDAKLFAVGDDYQSIYRFTGCNLFLFINLKKYIKDLNIIFLNYNYRNNQSLINIANAFIMKNKLQIKKNTICKKTVDKPIKIYFYKNKNNALNDLMKHVSGEVLILGRNNNDKNIFNVPDTMEFLTIHRAKGLEKENIILVNLNNSTLGFPSKIKNEKIILNLLTKNYIEYEEERRLFYVALTRAIKYIYILVPENNYSQFIKELIKDNKKKLDIIYNFQK